MKMKLVCLCFSRCSGLLAAVLLLLCLFNSQTMQAQQTPSTVFAMIDDIVITSGDYRRIFDAAVRNRYYHGKVPQKELARFQREVGRDLVDQVLIHREAQRLGLQPDSKKIKAGLAEYDARYSHKPEWQNRREQELPAMLIQLERRDLLLQMNEMVRQLPEPTFAEAEQYYREHTDKFTEPERRHVSIILLKVSPSAGSAAWKSARLRAEEIQFRLNEGAEFTALAKEYSGDYSASTGGDLGYLHSGMLANEAEKALDQLAVGEVTEPVVLLEGIALLRLNGLITAKLKDFSEVKQRAQALLKRELQEQAWQEFLHQLRDASKIEVNESLYFPLSEELEKEERVQAESGTE